MSHICVLSANMMKLRESLEHDFVQYPLFLGERGKACRGILSWRASGIVPCKTILYGIGAYFGGLHIYRRRLFERLALKRLL